MHSVFKVLIKSPALTHRAPCPQRHRDLHSADDFGPKLTQEQGGQHFQLHRPRHVDAPRDQSRNHQRLSPRHEAAAGALLAEFLSLAWSKRPGGDVAEQREPDSGEGRGCGSNPVELTSAWLARSSTMTRTGCMNFKTCSNCCTFLTDIRGFSVQQSACA